MSNHRALAVHLLNQAPAELTPTLLRTLLDTLPPNVVRKAACPTSKTAQGRENARALESYLYHSRPACTPVPSYRQPCEARLTLADLVLDTDDCPCASRAPYRCRCC